jgi:succinate dehydrogenase / fumarate reductase membrane anchor subunit
VVALVRIGLSFKKALNIINSNGGTAHFWAQRLSAIGVFFAGLWFIYSVLQMPGFEYYEALEFIDTPFNSLMLIFLIFIMAYHSNLGIQVVVEDYVHAHKLKLVSLIISCLSHILLVGAAIFAIIKIRLGA